MGPHYYIFNDYFWDLSQNKLLGVKINRLDFYIISEFHLKKRRFHNDFHCTP